MKITEFYIESFDHFRLSAKVYEADRAKAVVQIVHGMCEHKERYDFFAGKLTENGYDVVISDLRGHGLSVGEDGLLGYFGKKDGPETLIEDQFAVNKFIKDRFPQQPVYLFAHSMGSLIARNYLPKYDSTIEKLILSGAPCYRRGCGFACALSKAAVLFSGAENCNQLIKSFAPGGGKGDLPNAWLSYNKQNVKEYNEDKMCGFPFTNAGYLTLYELDRRLHDFKRNGARHPMLDILFLAGEDDPVTGGRKGLQDSADSLRKAGYRNVAMKTYAHMRHEILKEAECELVIRDAISFFDR
ncbi:MAG: alpha/beta fold hydrolase [Clostridia bacterium]